MLDDRLNIIKVPHRAWNRGNAIHFLPSCLAAPGLRRACPQERRQRQLIENGIGALAIGGQPIAQEIMRRAGIAEHTVRWSAFGGQRLAASGINR